MKRVCAGQSMNSHCRDSCLHDSCKIPLKAQVIAVLRLGRAIH